MIRFIKTVHIKHNHRRSRWLFIYRHSPLFLAYALLVLFFVSGVMKTAGDFTSLKRPEGAFKISLRFALAKAAITYSIHITTAFFQIAQGIVSAMIGSSGLAETMPVELPERMAEPIEDVGLLDSIPLWAVILLGCLLIWVLSTVIILTVYSRFFRLYIATAIAPIPLAFFAGEPTSSVGKSFLKSYAGICLEGCVIVLCCIIFSSFATTSPALRNLTGSSDGMTIPKSMGKQTRYPVPYAVYFTCVLFLFTHQ